jgi:hypothetical protein
MSEYVLTYIAISAIYATLLLNRSPISLLKAVAVGLLSPLVIAVSILSIVYMFLGIHVSILIATYSDGSEIGPTQNEEGDE